MGSRAKTSHSSRMKISSVLLLCLLLAIVSFNEGESKPGFLSVAGTAGRGIASGMRRGLSGLTRIGSRIGRGLGRIGNGIRWIGGRTGSFLARRVSTVRGIDDILKATLIGLPVVAGGAWTISNVLQRNELEDRNNEWNDAVQFFYCQVKPIQDNLKEQLPNIVTNLNLRETADDIDVKMSVLTGNLVDFDKVTNERCNEERFKRRSSNHPSQFLDNNGQQALMKISTFSLKSAGSSDLMKSFEFVNDLEQFWIIQEGSDVEPAWVIVWNQLYDAFKLITDDAEKLEEKFCLSTALQTGSELDSIQC